LLEGNVIEAVGELSWTLGELERAVNVPPLVDLSDVLNVELPTPGASAPAPPPVLLP
jgi:hypothetical protein